MSCILIKYTYDQNFELIQPLVQKYNTLFFYKMDTWRPYLKSDRAEIR
jgi:hypothetical protein